MYSQISITDFVNSARHREYGHEISPEGHALVRLLDVPYFPVSNDTVMLRRLSMEHANSIVIPVLGRAIDEEEFEVLFTQALTMVEERHTLVSTDLSYKIIPKYPPRLAEAPTDRQIYQFAQHAIKMELDQKPEVLTDAQSSLVGIVPQPELYYFAQNVVNGLVNDARVFVATGMKSSELITATFLAKNCVRIVPILTTIVKDKWANAQG